MRVVEVTYERLTKHRVGQYENERAACTVRVEEGESAVDAMELAKYTVEEQLGLLPDESEVNNALTVLRKVGYDFGE